MATQYFNFNLSCQIKNTAGKLKKVDKILHGYNISWLLRKFLSGPIE
jgi:hypothetical protein